MLIPLLLICVGVALLVAGGESMLRGSVGLAKIWRLTPAVIGLTVVAAGTSVPELAVSVLASLHGKTDIAVANVVGSNIFNIAIIVGACAAIRPLAIEGNTIRLEYPVLAIATLMWPGDLSGRRGQSARRPAVLLGAFRVYRLLGDAGSRAGNLRREARTPGRSAGAGHRERQAEVEPIARVSSASAGSCWPSARTPP